MSDDDDDDRSPSKPGGPTSGQAPMRISVRPPGAGDLDDLEAQHHTTLQTLPSPQDLAYQAVAKAPPILRERTGGHVGLVLAGKYRLLARIGSGGMGEVYRAEHVTLRMPVAVKLLHYNISIEPDYVRRFYREARAATLLDHPNVVRVIDYGEDEGLPFLVMEYLVGVTLHSWLRDRDAAPPLTDIRDILGQILDAFDVAHARGIVHRDLKPENVFLTEVGGKRTVKILDFGLAHVELPKEDDSGPTLTKPEAVGGTPEYMSPEQCHSLAVGPATDIYAIGCVLTAMLQGRPPFLGKNSIEIISAHLFLPPPPLARPTGAEPVPPLLEKLRLEMLAKQPERRPANAGVAKKRLEDALDPQSLATQLVTRKGNEPLGGRASRAPQWEGQIARAEDATDPGHGLTEVGWIRMPSASGIDPSCVTGLASQGIYLIPLEALDDKGRANLAVVLIDAGADIDGAAAHIAELSRTLPRARVLVCASSLTPERMTRLVSAGAADVANAPAGPDGLGKKIGRILRRGR
ncbi:serine/threonine-protein kinase [Polyangium fumosum]|uniref:Serine/threonine protein kinase n=1 Tax=Polyangium fumosum TaxID=889272 RepID=A0A4U1IMF1_9BACT|nr:serine/threonine-protein kinase [Polyangium fumosum]TKC95196.1 serine/threonine protein kinase [Polyangium fumosum]